MTTSKPRNASPLALDRRALLLGAMVSVLALGPAEAGGGLVLIMVEEPGCQYCRKFDAEIGPGYSHSREGRTAPLMRVHRHAAQLRGLAPVIYTPTFILMRHGEEIGRITGYPGRDDFYPELSSLLSKVGDNRQDTAPRPG